MFSNVTEKDEAVINWQLHRLGIVLLWCCISHVHSREMWDPADGEISFKESAW